MNRPAVAHIPSLDHSGQRGCSSWQPDSTQPQVPGHVLCMKWNMSLLVTLPFPKCLSRRQASPDLQIPQRSDLSSALLASPDGDGYRGGWERSCGSVTWSAGQQTIRSCDSSSKPQAALVEGARVELRRPGHLVIGTQSAAELCNEENALQLLSDI